MSTNSRIGKLNEDGTVTSIYCHWDGYPSYVGKILVENYDNTTAVNKLIDLGNISELNETIDTVVAYKRDRNETKCEPLVHSSAQWPGFSSVYHYLWIPAEGRWKFRLTADDPFWSDLKNALDRKL
jgi:hypothetical protein